MEDKYKNRLSELKDEAYHAENMISGCWSHLSADGRFGEVDIAHKQAVDALKNLFNVTEKVLRPNKDDERYQDWLNRHGLKND